LQLVLCLDLVWAVDSRQVYMPHGTSKGPSSEHLRRRVKQQVLQLLVLVPLEAVHRFASLLLVLLLERQPGSCTLQDGAGGADG
jgi:hypothetical protein